MEHQHEHDTAMPGMDHSKMNHTNMRHEANPSMGMAGHNHHAMMIDDFKKRFYAVLILTVPFMLLSTMIQHFIEVHWQFAGSKYIMYAQSSLLSMQGY